MPINFNLALGKFKLGVNNKKERKIYLQNEKQNEPVDISRNNYAKKVFTYTPDISYIGEYDRDQPTVDQYRKMQYDPDLSFGLTFIKVPLLTLRPIIEESSGNIELDNFVLENLSMFWDSLLSSTFNGTLVYGNAPHEIIYDQQDINLDYEENGEEVHKVITNAIVIKGFKPIDQNNVEYQLKDGELAKIIVRDNSGTHELELDKGFVAVRDRKYLDYNGTARLRPCFGGWYKDEVQEQLKQRYYEKRAGSGFVVEYPPQTIKDDGSKLLPGDTDENQTAAENIAKNYMDTPYVLIPYQMDKDTKENKWKVYFLEDKGQAGDAFDLWKKDLRIQKLHGLGITDRALTQDDVGSMAIGQEHGDTFRQSLTIEARYFINDLNKYIVPLIVRYNYGSGIKLPRIGYAGIEPWKVDILKGIITDMVKLGTFDSDTKRVSVKQLSKIFGIPMEDKPKEEPEIIDQEKEKMGFKTDKIGSFEDYPNEIRHRISDPDKYSEFRRKEITNGVSIILGKLKNDDKWETQAYRFDKEKFTMEQARKWIQDNFNINLKTIKEERKKLFDKALKNDDKRMKRLVEIEDKNIDSVGSIFNEQTDRLMNTIKTELKDNLNFKTISDLKIPFMGKYKDAISKFNYNVYELGIDTIKEEMGDNGRQIKRDIPLKYRQWLNFKTEMVADNLEHFYKSNIKKIISENQEKPFEDILGMIDLKFKELKDTRLEQSIRNNGIEILNQARWNAVSGFVQTV